MQHAFHTYTKGHIIMSLGIREYKLSVQGFVYQHCVCVVAADN